MDVVASVIVVNWNGKRFLEPCLDALLGQTFSALEIIVVDNGSDDGSVALLNTRYRSTITLIENKTNRGFAGGNNQGIMVARGAYIVTLNTDTVVGKEWLAELVQTAASEHSIGMCGSKILLMEKPGRIDSVGVNIYPDGTSRQRGHLEPDDGRYASEEEILLPSACAALYRRAMLDEIGLFDETFFAYCEDTDLGLRGRLAGWKAVLAPKAVVCHHYSGTAGKYSAFKAYHVERNHIWVALKNMPVGMLAMVPIFSVIRFSIQCWDMVTLRSSKPDVKIGKMAILYAVLQAYAAAVAGIPGQLKKRVVIKSKRTLSSREVRELFKRFALRVGDVRFNR